MKKLIPFLLLTFLLAACEKDKSNDNPAGTSAYINTASGSSWTYHEVNNSGSSPQESDYTVTSTDRDTTIEGKSFHIYAYSYGGFQYLSKINSSYYQYDSIPGLGNAFVRLYLKSSAKVGETWDQNFNIAISGIPASIPVKLSNKIIEIGSRTVNGINYENVIHVRTTVSSSLIPASDLHSDINTYYAENYGLIESSVDIDLDYFGITESVDIDLTLTSATLK